MTERRNAPTIPGLTLVERIGSGGFADVYLYEQEFPSRKVAVKVLHAAESKESLAQFYAEANVMAQLSGHPAIVAIHAADVGDDGRPYIVMEYCPPPALASQYRTEHISIVTALDIGIRIASAVETVHRAGLLHRDIKPHNILTSAFGAPKLTDFGIAGAAGEATAQGMSVPWAPPEWFTDTTAADPRGDVFSLAATLYSLLAGRSPFEVPGAANDNATLMNRIERQPLARLTRPDVPDSLNQALARAMAKNPAQRPTTAFEFARQLQDVQTELGHAQTRIEVHDASTAGLPVEDNHRTFIRPVQIIVPDSPEEVGTLLRPRFVSPVPDHTQVHAAAPPAATLMRTPAPDAPAEVTAGGAGTTGAADAGTDPDATATAPSTAPTRSSRGGVLVGVVVGVLLLTGVGVGVLFGGDDPDDPARALADEPEPPVAMAEYVEPPTDLAVATTPRGRVTFTWKSRAAGDGDRFGLQYEVGGAPPETVTKRAPRHVAKVAPGAIVCAQVALVRANGQASQFSDRVCEKAER